MTEHATNAKPHSNHISKKKKEKKKKKKTQSTAKSAIWKSGLKTYNKAVRTKSVKFAGIPTNSPTNSDFLRFNENRRSSALNVRKKDDLFSQRKIYIEENAARREKK